MRGRPAAGDREIGRSAHALHPRTCSLPDFWRVWRRSSTPFPIVAAAPDHTPANSDVVAVAFVVGCRYRRGMKPSDLRVALFSGNYTYVRDAANQALNLLVGHLLARGVHVRVYSPTVAETAFAPTGDLVAYPPMPLIGGRGDYRVAGGIPRRLRRDLDALDRKSAG